MSSRAHETSAGVKVSIRRKISARAVVSWGSMGRMSMASFEGGLHEAEGEVGVAEPGAGGGFREARVRVEIAVGVDVDDVRLTFRRDAEIHPPIVPAVERLEGSHRGFHHPY